MKQWLLIGFFFYGCSFNTSTMNEDDFSKLFKNSLQKAIPDAEITINETLSIKARLKDQVQILKLDNVYRNYKKDPSSLNEVIDNYVNFFVNNINSSNQFQANKIMPVIRTVENLNDIKLQIQKLKKDKALDSMIYDKYNEQLIVAYVEDLGSRVRFINSDDLKKANVERKDLWEFSVNNLRKTLTDVKKVGENGSYELTSCDNYESSTILLKEYWDKSKFDIDGDFVVAIPNHNIIYITGTNNKKGIEDVKAKTKESYATVGHPLSPYIFKWNGKKFEKYEP